MGASYRGHLDLVRFLVLQANAAIEASRRNHITPLALAAGGDHLDVVRVLLLAGADAAPCFGRSPILTPKSNVLATIAAAAYDAAGATATLIASLSPLAPAASVTAAWAGAAFQAQETWLMDALARAFPGERKLNFASAVASVSLPLRLFSFPLG
jgi:ankyrin repeat protein